jgi:hypothetical protein
MVYYTRSNENLNEVDSIKSTGRRVLEPRSTFSRLQQFGQQPVVIPKSA